MIPSLASWISVSLVLQLATPGRTQHWLLFGHRAKDIRPMSMKLTVLTTPVTTESGVAFRERTCPAQWKVRGMAFFYIELSLSQSEAADYCNWQGGRLMEIENQETSSAMMKEIKGTISRAANSPSTDRGTRWLWIGSSPFHRDPPHPFCDKRRFAETIVTVYDWKFPENVFFAHGYTLQDVRDKGPAICECHRLTEPMGELPNHVMPSTEYY